MQKADENNLKSSMDRFIVKTVQHSRKRLVNLKSSMDRFIEVIAALVDFAIKDLKSSMDRFIVSRCSHAGMEA